MRNAAAQLRELLPRAPLLVGTVAAIIEGGVRVTLPGGGVIVARGQAELGVHVFVRDGALEGSAPALAVVAIEV